MYAGRGQRMCAALATGQSKKPLDRTFAGGVGTTDDQDGILAGNRPEDVWVLLGVNRFGNWLGTGNLGADHEELTHPVKPNEELREYGRKRRTPLVRRPGTGSSGVADSSGGWNAGDAQVAHVARQRTLRHVPPLFAKQLTQLFLACHDA